MRHVTFGWFGVAFGLASSLATAAAAAEFGHMRYDVPAGWTEKRYTTGVILSLNRPPAGEQLEIQLMTPAAATGTLAEALATSWDDACVQLGVTKKRTVNNLPYEPAEARKSFKGWSYVHGTGEVTAKANGAEYFVDLFVIQVDRRLERLLVLSPMRTHNVSRYSLYESRAHRRAARAFVFAMKFDDWTDAVVAPATLKGEGKGAGVDGIVGVWQGISMFGGQFKAAYAIFYSNGQAFFGSRFPMAGCDAQDTWIEAEETPRYWGTYAFKDGAGVLNMPFGEIPVRSKADGGLTLTTSHTDHAFARVPAVDGARFDGAYVMAEAYERIPTIAFTAAGRFRDAGALRTLDHDYTNVFAIPTEPGAGTYAVKDHTVTFRYDDGRVYRLAFPGAGYDKADPSPATLTLGYNEDPLTRK